MDPCLTSLLQRRKKLKVYLQYVCIKMSRHYLVGGHCCKLDMTRTRKVRRLYFLCILLTRVFLLLKEILQFVWIEKTPIGTAAYYEVGKLVQTQKVRPGEIFGRGYCRTASEGLGEIGC